MHASHLDNVRRKKIDISARKNEDMYEGQNEGA
jgi:hypothetical protein